MFTIVKYASKEYESQWNGRKPAEGVNISYSCYNTHSGMLAGLRPCYSTREEAEIDLKRIIEINPCVGYAVCPIIE